MILLNLDRNEKTPLSRQIYLQLAALIEENTLKPGERLPPTRQMAEQLGVNRSTVCNAYDELWAMGYLQSRPGSYSLVRKRFKTASHPPTPDQCLLDWGKLSSAKAAELHECLSVLSDANTPQDAAIRIKGVAPGFDASTLFRKEDHFIDMARLDLDPRLFPVWEFKRAVSEILAVYSAKYRDNESNVAPHGPTLFSYGDSRGYFPLREFIARRMHIHGVACGPHNILITNGAQNGFELILKLLTEPGNSVAVESPTYFFVLPLLKFHGLKTVYTPMTPEGADLVKLEEIFHTHRPAFFYTMPNFHNPTGITTRQEHREKLLTLCETFRIPLVEDGFEEEMKYFGKIPPPLKSMDQKGIVIYLGSFSKVLFPGLRTGWVAADSECIGRLGSLRRFSDLSANMFVQAALFEFCSHNDYDYHVKRMNRIYKKRMQTAISTLKKCVPPTIASWREPEGGYLIWLKILNTSLHEKDLVSHCAHMGVRITGGARFFPESSPEPHTFIRLSISMLNEQEIEEGITRLGNALISLSLQSPS